MELVVLDGQTVNPGDNPWDGIASFGRLTVYDRTKVEEIRERAAKADIVLTNKTPLSRETLAVLPNLRLVCELATGYDNIDVVAAAELGIPVANVPQYSTDSVAQHTFALILELCNKVGEHAAAVQEGEWCRSVDFTFCRGGLTELAGKTLGIVGLGRIGRRVAQIGTAFGMKILAYNPRSRTGLDGVNVEWLELRELFATADIISLHCPLSSENRGLVDGTLLRDMKPNAMLINTARGALINEADLAAALNGGVIAGAGLDVVSREPMTGDNPLLSARNCVITPHVAWASLDARRRLLKSTAENIAAFLQGTPRNLVNGAILKCSSL